jgi:hypothetical protein
MGEKDNVKYNYYNLYFLEQTQNVLISLVTTL